MALALADPAAAVTALETSWRLDPTLPFTGLWLGEALLARVSARPPSRPGVQGAALSRQPVGGAVEGGG
ncbi:hypothetical protein [Candidatus Amarolinea dominans]|uniref:hypothetical protein n=1 Tax=Candidatus Amarolinea dominans TaxID=3140696 RepID=UPI0031352ED2|nr:hypothetical protein [Anaerolineae bacterium]